jgi:SAM-dependent methyltransferase
MADRIEHISALSGYERWAETYDLTRNPVVALDARRSLPVLSLDPGERVLDAGCGTGRNLEGMLAAGTRPFGVDFSPAMLRVAHRRHPNARLVVANLQSPLPLADASFDAVLCSLVGEHLANLEGVFRELRRVVRPGGRMVFSVYHPEMATAGVEANFEENGVEYRLEAYQHAVDDYLDAIAEADFPQVVYREFKGDQELIDQMPEAKKFLGKPMLLVIAALAD